MSSWFLLVFVFTVLVTDVSCSRQSPPSNTPAPPPTQRPRQQELVEMQVPSQIPNDETWNYCQMNQPCRKHQGDCHGAACVCRKGFYGHNCLKKLTYCSTGMLYQECEGNCHDNDNPSSDYTCTCPPDNVFKLDETGRLCSDMNECRLNDGTGTCAGDSPEYRVENGQKETGVQFVCKNTFGSFWCRCPRGYKYEVNRGCKKLKACIVKPRQTDTAFNPCLIGGLATNVADCDDAIYRPGHEGQYKCICATRKTFPIYFGLHCQHEFCAKWTQVCLKGNAQCKQKKISEDAEWYEEACLCHQMLGLTGEECETDLCVGDNWRSEACHNHGECIGHTADSGAPDIDRFSCDCYDGFTGDRCETELDECASTPCQHQGECLDLRDSYACHCQMAFNGTNCEIDQCRMQTYCYNGGWCQRLNDFKLDCHCLRGFNGSLCENSWCVPSPCSNGRCEPLFTPPFYLCVCMPGFTGEHCELDINECDYYNGMCEDGATCSNSVGSYSCKCPLSKQPSASNPRNCIMEITDDNKSLCPNENYIPLTPEDCKSDTNLLQTGQYPCKQNSDCRFYLPRLVCCNTRCGGICVPPKDHFSYKMSCHEIIIPAEDCLWLTPCPHGDIDCMWEEGERCCPVVSCNKHKRYCIIGEII